jgi:outer membrane protein TolC
MLAVVVSSAGADDAVHRRPGSSTGLDTLTRTAERHNPGLRATRHNIAAAQERLNEAWVSPFFQFKATTAAGMAPEARGTPVVSPDSEFPVGNRWLPVLDAEIRGAVPLWTFGKLSAARDAARAGVRGAELERERTRARLIYDVRRAYFALQLALDIQQMIAEGKGKLEKAVERLEKRVSEDDPDVNPSDRYRLSSALAEIEARSSETDKLEASTRTALRILTGLDRIRVPECPLEPLQFEPDALAKYHKSARSNRPETGILDAAISASEANLDSYEAKYFPDLALALRAGTSYAPGVTNQNNPFVSDDGNSTSYGAALVAKWSLDIWGNIHRTRRAKSQLLEARAGREQALEGIELEVAEAYNALQDASRRVAAWERGRRDARRWFVTAAQADQVGVGEAEELVDAVRAYFKARYAHLQAIHDFNVGIARLERVLGTTLLPKEVWGRSCMEKAHQADSEDSSE